jgi:hypothetical protein
MVDSRVVLDKNLHSEDRSDTLVNFKERKNMSDLQTSISRLNLFSENIKITEVYKNCK